MKLNMEELQTELITRFENNQSEMARELGIERSQLNKVFKSNGKCAGANVYGAIFKFCKDNDIPSERFIFL